jgi:hypothetical protein
MNCLVNKQAMNKIPLKINPNYGLGVFQEIFQR